MSLPKARAAALQASPEDAEAQFYDALRDGDVERLMAVWADDDEIVCVHPGGARVVGPLAVRAAFESIFASGHISVQPEHVKQVHAMGCAVHSVLERIAVATVEGPQTGWILATNVYVKTSEGWRMVAHHASPGAPDEIPEAVETPSVLH
jgi:ketosteroid isomerase-like protein